MNTILNKKIAIAILSGFLTCSMFAQGSTQEKKLEEQKFQYYEMAKPQIIGNNGQKKIDLKDLKSKEISTEVSASKTADIYVENNNRQLEIKVWDQPKVKMVTTVYYEGDGGKLTDAEWFEKLNLTIRSTNSSIKIKSGTIGGGSYYSNGNSFSWSGSGEGVTVLNMDGSNNSKQENTKRMLTIYVPKENKLDIESKYSEVLISGNLNKLNADITNGGLELQDVNTLMLRSKYANVQVGNIKTAEVELINGRFIAKDADELDMDTKYATIEAGAVKKLTIRSTNDEYEIEEVGTLQCRKNYGNLRITKLNSSLELDGTNADLKIRNIAAGLEYIKINNKYADIRLPMRNVKNYSVAYLGAYSTVYAGFEKKPVEETAETKAAVKQKATSREVAPFVTATDARPGTETKTTGKEKNNISARTYLTLSDPVGDLDNHFTATVGDGKGAKLDLKCQNCTVDFK